MIEGVNGVHHIAISTGRWDEMMSFYRDVLGFALVDAFEWGVGDAIADAVTNLQGSSARAAMLKGANLCIELFEYRTPPPPPRNDHPQVHEHGYTHLCLDVSDAEAVYRELSARGMRFHTGVQKLAEHIRGTYGRDPDGNVIEIQELLDPNDPCRLSVIADRPHPDAST